MQPVASPLSNNSVGSADVITISLNKSSMGEDVVTLIVNGDPNKLLQYGADAKLAEYGIEVLNNDGKPPFGENMRALLNCDGGKLTYDGVTYKVQVEEGKFAGILYGHV